MSKLYFIKTKKASIEVSLVHLLEIILAIGIVLVLIYLSLKLSGLFLGRQEYNSAINNLEELYTRITELISDKKDISTQTIPYSIQDNYILVGFNYDSKDIVKTECTQENIFNSRPKSCQSKSCLCIYQNFGGVTDWSGEDFDSKGNTIPIKCKPFDEKVIFLAPSDSNFRGAPTQWKPSHYQSTNYNYLVLYGICGGPWQTSWGVRQIYIEKYKESDKIFVFIGDMSDKNIIERYNYFKNNNTN